jgi:hypothetical protein
MLGEPDEMKTRTHVHDGCWMDEDDDLKCRRRLQQYGMIKRKYLECEINRHVFRIEPTGWSIQAGKKFIKETPEDTLWDS